jgi:ssDNA-binding Zn-finger/Zn-ribbon topoisomerase 1
MKCPSCEGNLHYQLIKTETHAWICNDCPIIMFEYYYVNDIENLKKLNVIQFLQ